MEMPKNGLKKPEDQHKEHPLSPFLFIIVTDVLSRMWIRADKMGILGGFLVGRCGTRVTLSFFFLIQMWKSCKILSLSYWFLGSF